MDGKARPGAETQTLLAQMEEYLSGAKFNKALGECFSKAARGQGLSIASDEILMATVSGVCAHLPKTLRKAIPEPDKAFLDTALKSLQSKRPRTGCWKVEDFPELVQAVLVVLASTVDKFRAMGGYELDVTKM